MTRAASFKPEEKPTVLTFAEVAKRLRVSEKTLRGDWRKGEHRPASFHEIETLAWALASTIQKTRLERTNHHD